MSPLHIPTLSAVRCDPALAIRQVIAQAWKPAKTGELKGSGRLGDDITVTMWWNDTNNYLCINTYRGMEAVRQYRLHHKDKGFSFHEHKPTESAWDIDKLYNDLRKGKA